MYYNLDNFNYESSVVGTKDGMGQLELILSTSLKDDLIFQQLYEGDFEQELAQLDKIQAPIEFKLRKKGKITDLMTFSPYLDLCDFVVSDKLLESLLISNHEALYYLPVEILQNEERYSGYNIVQIHAVQLDDIDFSKSEFFLAKVPLVAKHELTRFEDADSFRSCAATIFNSVYPSHIEFKSNYKGGKDLLKIPNLGLVVSEKMKEEIAKHQFSNVRFSGVAK